MAPSSASRSRPFDAGRLGRLLRATPKKLTLLRLARLAEAVRHPRAAARKMTERVMTRAYAKLHLRACDQVGARARCFGPAWVDNKGTIVIGEDVTLGGDLGSVSLTCAPGGLLRVGDRVTVHHGSWISAAREVIIGSDVTLGPYCVVADAEADTPGHRENATPIVIGSGVRLAARVVVRPGARIGDGAVIGAGSVVEGDIPAQALASGVPARVIGVRDAIMREDRAARLEGRPRATHEEVSHACV